MATVGTRPCLSVCVQWLVSVVNMSRRKQLRPQQLQTLNTKAASPRFVHVCSRCCAEFRVSSDLEQHQRICCPDPPVLILNDDEDLPPSSTTSSSPAGPAGKPRESVNNSEMENMNSSQQRSCSRAPLMDGGVERPEADAALLPGSSPPPRCSAGSWMKSNVITEDLEITDAAAAQLSDSQQRQAVVSSLLQQLLVLQIQQIHQLQLIHQIRRQVLLFASHQAETPETLVDLSSLKSTYQLKTPRAHLPQQRAAAAERVKVLSAQSANRRDVKCFRATEHLSHSRADSKDSRSESSHTVRKLMTASEHVSCGSSHFLSQTNKLMFNSFISQTQPSASASASIPNLSEIVEDLDALAALARQRKGNLKFSALSSHESVFRHNGRVFGSDSDLKIHLRSHDTERPYRCNMCGNRFSTRGDLLVHLQRHRDTMNPDVVPEQLDKIQTTAGWSPSPNTTSSGALKESYFLSSLIKTEDDLTYIPLPFTQGDLYFNSAAGMKHTKTSDSAETRRQTTMTLKSEDVKPSLKLTSTQSEESVHVKPDSFTLPCSASFSGFLSFKRSNKPKLQLPPAASDPNQCVICHRTLSCQSALRMHLQTRTGERLYRCKLCGRAFTTKGNLKTYQTVHRVPVPLSVQHSCPFCHRKFMNAAFLQQHVHMEGHLHPGFRGKTVNNRENNTVGFKSLSIHLSPPPFSNTGVEANRKRSYPEQRGELQLTWIKTERPEGSNEECSQTNNRPAAETRQTFTTFDSSASESSPSPDDRASVCFKAARLDKPLHTWLDSNTLTLRMSAAAPADLTLFNHSEDRSVRAKLLLKSSFCDICGKSFACQSALDIHYRSHTKERPFICTTCSRGFSTKGNLKQHMLTHQMRDFPPHLFQPSNPNQAPDHSGSTLSVKTEMASFLNSCFRDGADLSGPTQSFSAAPQRQTSKQHHCRTCGKSFSSSSALQIHERTHTGERPFACAICARAFTTKGNLKVHMGTHMWNSATSRRGRRLGFLTRPVKLPETSQKNPAPVSSCRESVSHLNPPV
ncbi:sal-like protein 1 [Pagrus major]|uniref:sal-like protein 1 n=1 Tax=Pagrus major TaxID=143350 RepID=UPI003CC85D72